MWLFSHKCRIHICFLIPNVSSGVRVEKNAMMMLLQSYHAVDFFYLSTDRTYICWYI